MPTWPAGLPQKPQRDGYQKRPKPAVIAFGTEVGPGKRRRRSTRRSFPITARFIMTKAQADAFESFFQTELADGAAPFDWTDPVDGVIAEWQFDAEDPYAIVPLGGDWWSVTVNIEKLT